MSSDDSTSGQDDSQLETSSATDDNQQLITCLKSKAWDDTDNDRSTTTEEQSSAAESSDNGSSVVPCAKQCIKDQAQSRCKVKQKVKQMTRQHTKQKQRHKPRITRTNSNNSSTVTASTDDVDTSDTNTTTAAAEANNLPAVISKMVTSGALPVDSGWTLSDDAILRGMKTDRRSSVSWREIAKTLRQSQQACKDRWKTIQSLPSATPGSPTGSNAGTFPAPMPTTKGAAAAAGKKDKQRAQEMRQTKRKQTTTKSVTEEELKNEVGEADDEDTSDEDDGTYAFSNLERRRQRRYFKRHILGNLYPSAHSMISNPGNDETFSQQDCDILAACESRYEHVKWLEMQADFFNVTGRMIPLYVIRDKCERSWRG